MKWPLKIETVATLLTSCYRASPTWKCAVFALLDDVFKGVKDNAILIAIKGGLFELVWEVGDVCYIGALCQECLELGKQLMRSDDVFHLKKIIKNETGGKDLEHSWGGNEAEHKWYHKLWHQNINILWETGRIKCKLPDHTITLYLYTFPSCSLSQTPQYHLLITASFSSVNLPSPLPSAYLCLIDAVYYCLISQSGIQGAQGDALLEAPHSWDKPFFSCLGKDDNVLLWLVANRSKALAKVWCHLLHLCVGQPWIFTKLILNERWKNNQLVCSQFELHIKINIDFILLFPWLQLTC